MDIIQRIRDNTSTYTRARKPIQPQARSTVGNDHLVQEERKRKETLRMKESDIRAPTLRISLNAGKRKERT